MLRLAALVGFIGLLLVTSGDRDRALVACGQDVAIPCVTTKQEAQQESSPEERLAQRHAPIVYLREQKAACDRKGEAFEPVAVEFVLDNPDVQLKRNARGRPTLLEGPTASDLFQGSSDLYLNYPGNPRRPGCGYERYFKEHGMAYERVAYAHIVREPGFDSLVLQYWFFYYFNDWNNTHEGDWEMVQLVFDATTAEQALAREPTSLAYAQHGGGETASWTDDKLEREGTRPVIYIAKGAHASFYSQATFFGKGEEGTGFGCDDASGPSRRVDPEVRLIPDDVTGPDDPYAWITYEGRWGELRRSEFNGPTGPNTKRQWTQPLTWQEGLRDSSVKVPNVRQVPNVVDAFCAVVAFGSEWLIQGRPYIVLGAAALVLGSVATTLRRTRFRPVTTRPLAARRQFGQILRAALAIERQHAGLFLGIGALFVPLGFLTAGIQSLVLVYTPLRPVIEVLDSPWASGVVALSLGGLQFGIAYWVVVCATIAALGEVDAGADVGIFAAYRKAWERWKLLVSARLSALVVIALLSLTVVGLPLALRYAVRWEFLEQAILLDGRDAHGARQTSVELVTGHWWRALGVTVAVGTIGIVTGPAIGIGILLLSSASLMTINIVSAIIYLAFIPYVAIALTLLYYDLKLARAEVR